MSFVTILAKVRYRAGWALRNSRLAHVASVQNEPVMSVSEKLGRHRFHEPILDFSNRLAARQAGSIRDSKNVGVHRHGGLAERRVQNHVGGFSADPRQLLE